MATRAESGYTTLKRVAARPALDVNGIWGRCTGEGAKTVIASQAHAKISMRLMPNQTSVENMRLFQIHFEALAKQGVSVEVRDIRGGDPGIMPLDSVVYRAAGRPTKRLLVKVPLPLRGGRSIALVSVFKYKLGLGAVMMGFGLGSDTIHSPNESYVYLASIEKHSNHHMVSPLFRTVSMIGA